MIYAWSQFLRDPNADLPGRLVLLPLVRAEKWVFGGTSWRKFCESRRYSTAFTAPITYGPSLKTLGWLEPHRDNSEVLIPTPAAVQALDAFEARIKRRLDHPAFSQFGMVSVTRREAKRWSEAWALDQVTVAEKHVMTEMLLGSGAPLARRKGCELMLAAVAHANSADVVRVRQTMAGAPSNFVPRADLLGSFEAWRRLQVRQLFRLVLEAFLYWTIGQIESGPRTTDALVEAFIDQAGRPNHRSAHEWLNAPRRKGNSPTTLMDRIGHAMDDTSRIELAAAIAEGLSFCIAEAPEHEQAFERVDRLPLSRARREADVWGTAPAKSFVRHTLKSWVLAQHVYWSVGRGLADARARGKTILRLKVVLEEGGWTLAPGVSRGRPPVPTPDRLETALTLATECGSITVAG